MARAVVVLVTCGKVSEARRIARAVVAQRLAACVNIVGGGVHSIYRWKGKVESANEILLVMKTTRARFAALERAIRRMHSYDTPEILALAITAGSRAYLDWVRENTRR